MEKADPGAPLEASLRPQLPAAEGCPGLQAPPAGLSAAPGLCSAARSSPVRLSRPWPSLTTVSGFLVLAVVFFSPPSVAQSTTPDARPRLHRAGSLRLRVAGVSRQRAEPDPAGRAEPQRGGKDGTPVSAGCPPRRPALRQRRARGSSREAAGGPSRGTGPRCAPDGRGTADGQRGERPGAASVTHAERRFFK